MARLIEPYMTYNDANGVPLNGGKLKFLVAETPSTLKDTFTDQDLTPGNENTNPIILDSAGRANVDVFGSGDYKLVVLNSADVEQETFDHIEGGGLQPTATFTTLKALDVAAFTDGDTIYVEGRAAVGDGGEGHFKITSSNPGADNGGTILHSDTAGWYFVRQDADTVTPEMFGLTGLGNDAGPLIEAAGAAVGNIGFPGTYQIDTPVVFSSAIRLRGLAGHSIVPSLGLGGGKVFAFETDDVDVQDLVFDAAGETFTPATGNTYCLFGGDGATKRYNHKYNNNKILNMSFSDGNTGATNLLVSHGIYVDNVNDVEANSNIIDTLSGACVFLRDVEHFSIQHNRFEDNRWYTINIVEGCKHGDVGHNDFLSGTAEGIYWGGAINTVSDQGLVKNSDILFHHNYFTGTYSYAAVIRLQSSDDVVVEYNKMDGLSVGTANASNDLNGIRTVTRGISASVKAEPCQNITIRYNTLYGPSSVTGKRHAIYISNEWWAASNPSYVYNVYKNKIYSPDGTNYWEDAIIFHGQTGGIEEIWVEDNYAEVLPAASAVVGGGIGFIGISAEGVVDHIRIGGNTVIEMGTPASSYQIGIALNAFCNNITNTKPNRLKNHFYGVRTLANSGPTLDRLDDQFFDTCTTDVLEGVALSRHDARRWTKHSTVHIDVSSGISIEWTDIPAWATELKIVFADQSFSNGADLGIRLGDSSSFESSGYSGATTTSAGSTGWSAEGLVTRVATAADITNGSIFITHMTGNQWSISTSSNHEAGGHSAGEGSKTLTGTLTRAQLVSDDGVGTFDATGGGVDATLYYQ